MVRVDELTAVIVVAAGMPGPMMAWPEANPATLKTVTVGLPEVVDAAIVPGSAG
jgi:hypothetical protein